MIPTPCLHLGSEYFFPAGNTNFSESRFIFLSFFAFSPARHQKKSFFLDIYLVTNYTSVVAKNE